jgi:hypothetical protein
MALILDLGGPTVTNNNTGFDTQPAGRLDTPCVIRIDS